MSKVKAIKLYAGQFKTEVIDISKEDFLDDCYEHINCRCIDITTGIHKEHYIDIVVDDEGLLKDDCVANPIAWYLYSKCDARYVIVGNALLIGTNEDGETVDVPKFFIDNLDDIVMSTQDAIHNKLRQILD